jgi:hypothetical protein
MKISRSVLSAWRRWSLAIAWSAFGTLAAQVDLPPPSTGASPIAAPVRRVTFFSPDPPPLGAPLPAASAPGDPAAAAPAELAAYVNEPFYAALGTRLALHNLSQEQQRRLEDYRDAKIALQTELRAHLDALKEADAPTRLRTLETFALEQTPRIAELEAASERLRHDLAAGLMSSGFDWNEYHRWVRANQPSTVARVAAFFVDGLSPAQRRFLREMAIEPTGTNQRSAGASVPPADTLPWSFSPDMARMRLPADLSPSLAAKVTAYTREKAELKEKLHDIIYAPDSTAAGEPLASTLARFAQEHEHRFAALDKLAEEIRRELALRPDLPQALSRLALPQLSPELEARVTAYRRDKLDLQKALLARVEEVSKNFPPPRAPAEKGKSGPGNPGTERDEKIRQAIAAFTHENAGRYAALEKNKEAIRSDLARLAGTGAIVVKGPNADVLSRNFSEALQQLETWRNYRDYQVAVFEPGLSPEQRRLLFDFAVEKLALPLPAGENLPDWGSR